MLFNHARKYSVDVVHMEAKVDLYRFPSTVVCVSNPVPLGRAYPPMTKHNSEAAD
jgi:hypothetical protein